MAEAFEKIDLPSGAWVSFRDPRSITHGQRKPLERARTRIGMAKNLIEVFQGNLSPAALDDSEVDLLEAMMESVVEVLADDWSVEIPDGEGSVRAPSIRAAFDGMSEDDYQALITAAQPHRNTLIPDFGPAARADEDGRENPTGPSPASKTRSAGGSSKATSPKTTSEPGGS